MGVTTIQLSCVLHAMRDRFLLPTLTARYLEDVKGDAVEDQSSMFFSKEFKRLKYCSKLRRLRATAWLICRLSLVCLPLTLFHSKRTITTSSIGGKSSMAM
jgi:hypothetical protein